MPRKTEKPYRAGFVAIVGRPNVGKSTLLNRILGEHVAIVSPRPQTTRSRILGVHNQPGAQLAFFDTPGLHRAKGALNRRMVETALKTLGEVDEVLFLIEAGTGPAGRVEVGEATRWAVAEVKRAGKALALSPVEFRLLEYLLEHRGAVDLAQGALSESRFAAEWESGSMMTVDRVFDLATAHLTPGN